MKEKCKCGNPGCNKEAEYFHSRCCNAHFEGVIREDGRFAIVCEKCGLFVAYIERNNESNSIS